MLPQIHRINVHRQSHVIRQNERPDDFCQGLAQPAVMPISVEGHSDMVVATVLSPSLIANPLCAIAALAVNPGWRFKIPERPSPPVC